MALCAAGQSIIDNEKKREDEECSFRNTEAKNLPQHFCPQRVYRKSTNNVQSAIHYQKIMTRTRVSCRPGGLYNDQDPFARRLTKLKYITDMKYRLNEKKCLNTFIYCEMFASQHRQ